MKKNVNHTEVVEQYFDNQQDYFKNNNPVIRLRKEIIHTIIGDIQNVSIVDIGSGNGELTNSYIKNNQLTYIDVSVKLLDLIAEKNKMYKDHIELIKGDFLELAMKEKYDFVICIGLIAHISNIKKLIEKLALICKDNGKIVIQFTDNAKLISKLNNLKIKYLKKNKYQYKTNKTSAKELLKTISEFNLSIEKEIAYWPISPFFSFHNETKQFNALKYTMKNNFLRSFSSEKIWILKNI